MLSRRTLLAAAAATLPLGCAGRVPFRVGYQKNGLLLAAKARGAIEAALPDRAVAWRDFPSGPPLLEALSVGSGVGGIDFGGSGDTPPIFSQYAGAAFVYVAAQPVSGDAAAIITPAASKLRTVADLRGAKVAFTRASSSQRFVQAALATGGLTLADIAPINLTPTQAAAAFAAGAVDAWATWDPFLAEAEVASGARVLVAGHGLARSDSFIVANARVAAASPATIVAALDALAATAAWATANRSSLAALIAAGDTVGPAVAARIAMRQDLAITPLTPAVVARQQRIADDLHADGALPARVAVAAAMWRGWRGGAAASRSP